MNQRNAMSSHSGGPCGCRGGYTLVEILVATALTLVLMAAVMEMFKRIGDAINNSRAVLEMAEQLRGATATMGRDLEGITVVPQPPRRPESGEGYLRINDAGGAAIAGDGISGQSDQILFTARSTTRPFTAPNGTQSDLAEVMWYLAGNALHRRVVPIFPGQGRTLTDLTSTAKRATVPGGATDDILIPQNVVGFDVKVWDQNSNAYIDSAFDTGSTLEQAPATTASLRGIQIKIRMAEPVSKSVREVTVVHDFVPK
jgi:type II secretory pathway component PulJ